MYTQSNVCTLAMDLRILLLATILVISASNGHQETKKSATFKSVSAVLNNMGAIRKIASIAKKKMMRTRVLKDEETCGTCVEMVEDFKTLIASDYAVNDINSLGGAVRLLIISNIFRYRKLYFLDLRDFLYGNTRN